MSKGLHQDSARKDFKALNSDNKITWDVLPWYLKTSVVISLIIGFIYGFAIFIGLIGAFI